MLNLKDLLEDPHFSAVVPYEVLNFKGKDTILEEDDEGRDIYFILRGEVQVATTLPEQLNNITPGLACLQENDFFGELAMFDGEPRSAEVIAVTDCEIVKIDGPSFISYMDENPDKGYFILRDFFMNLVRHLRQNNIRTKTVLQLYLNETTS